MRLTILAGAYLLLLLLAGCNKETSAGEDPPAPTTPRTLPNSLEQLRNDMLLTHEAPPSGVPESYGWSKGPRVGYGNTPPADWTAMITWGQVYRTAASTAAPNTRVHLRNLRTWYLSKQTGEWTLWQQSDSLGGANYAEDFQQDRNEPADLRAEPEVGYSATLRPGFNFHFWPTAGRVSIDPDDIAGVWTAIDGRLLLDDPTASDDRAGAALILSVGADYWRDLAAPWDQWTTNGDIAIGRFRFLTEDWQTYNMHTISDSLLTANPPPIN